MPQRKQDKEKSASSPLRFSMSLDSSIWRRPSEHKGSSATDRHSLPQPLLQQGGCFQVSPKIFEITQEKVWICILPPRFSKIGKMKKWLFPIDKVNQQSGHNTTKETGNYAHGQHGFTQSGTINAHLHRLMGSDFRIFHPKCHFIWIPQYTLRLKAILKSREKFVFLAKLPLL